VGPSLVGWPDLAVWGLISDEDTLDSTAKHLNGEPDQRVLAGPVGDGPRFVVMGLWPHRQLPITIPCSW